MVTLLKLGDLPSLTAVRLRAWMGSIFYSTAKLAQKCTGLDGTCALPGDMPCVHTDFETSDLEVSLAPLQTLLRTESCLLLA